MVFSKVHPACHNIANGINQEVTLNRLIGTLPIALKLYVGRKVIYVICIHCSYNNVTKPDKKTFLLAFESYIPLRCCLCV